MKNKIKEKTLICPSCGSTSHSWYDSNSIFLKSNYQFVAQCLKTTNRQLIAYYPASMNFVLSAD